MITLKIVLVLAAVIIFFLAGFNVFPARVNLVAIALGLWAASTIVP